MRNVVDEIGDKAKALVHAKVISKDKSTAAMLRKMS